MTTTSDRSTPRTGRLPRRSRRGLIVNLSAAQAITLLVAVLLVAASIPMVGVGAAFWVALLAAGPLTAAALVRGSTDGSRGTSPCRMSGKFALVRSSA